MFRGTPLTNRKERIMSHESPSVTSTAQLNHSPQSPVTATTNTTTTAWTPATTATTFAQSPQTDYTPSGTEDASLSQYYGKQQLILRNPAVNNMNLNMNMMTNINNIEKSVEKFITNNLNIKIKLNSKYRLDTKLIGLCKYIGRLTIGSNSISKNNSNTDNNNVIGPSIDEIKINTNTSCINTFGNNGNVYNGIWIGLIVEYGKGDTNGTFLGHSLVL